jgi:hypothetical protein
VRDALESSRHLADVRADQAQAQAYGIQGVPFFVIDGKYGVSGAQPAEAFAQIARQVWAEGREQGSSRLTLGGSDASIAAMTSGASGFVCGRKRCTSPVALTRNFSKFHITGPRPSTFFAFFSAL